LKDVKKYLQKMESQNICGILDYAAEAPTTGKGSIDYTAAINRTMESIKFASESLKYPFLATKMTGLMEIERLFEASEMILISREAFRLFSQGSGDLWNHYGSPFDFGLYDRSPVNYNNYKLSMELLKEDPISEDRWEAIARLIKGPGSLVSPQSDTPLKIEFYEWENAMFRFLESKQPKNEPIWEILRSFHDKRINIANDFKGLGHFSINIGNARLEAVLESS